MDCPKCEETLVRQEIESVAVDECPGCRGIWFDRDELREAKDSAEPDANWLDFDVWSDPGDLVGTLAAAYASTDVEIDHCATCGGTWLDHGEFRKIVDALYDEINTKPSSDYVRAALEEAVEIANGPETLLSEWRDLRTVLRLLQYRLLAEHPKVASAIAEAQRSSPIR